MYYIYFDCCILVDYGGKMKLNLGSGQDYKEDYVNIDIVDFGKLDIQHDLNKTPYPFKDNQFEEIYANSILEHLDKPIEILKELTRITKNNGKIIIIVPHANSYANLTDLQHLHNFTENTFNEELLLEYGLTNIKLISRKLYSRSNSNKWKEFIPFRKYLKIFLNGLYDDIEFIFEVIK